MGLANQYICRRCGLRVRVWGKSDGGTYWKHSGAGGARKSCGLPPDVITKAQRNKESDDATGTQPQS